MNALILAVAKPIRALVIVGLLVAAVLGSVWRHTRQPPPPVTRGNGDALERVANTLAAPSVANVGSVRAVRTRAIPCVERSTATEESTETIALRALDDDPVVCGGKTCLRIQDGAPTVIVDAPSTPALPLAAEVRATAASPSACLAARCKSFGPRLAAAVTLEVAREAPRLEATFDLSTVVVGTQMWSVARDRALALPRPYYHPNEEISRISVAGNVLLVKWDGYCIDSGCEISQLVDRQGRELSRVMADGRVLRLDDRRIVTFSVDSMMEVRDLNTGKKIGEFDPRVHSGDFIDAVRLNDDRFAVLRSFGYDGVQVEMFSVAYDHTPSHSDPPVYLAVCDSDDDG